VYKAWFTGFHNRKFKRPLTDIVYQDDDGGLLDVEHDLAALRTQSAEDWKALFDARWMSHEWPYSSGIWSKLEWVYPGIDLKNVVSFAEGGTNLWHAQRLGQELGVSNLWIKMCGNTHTGSFKDLGMTVLVSAVKEMLAHGQPIRAVACASTGDTSAALSAYCAAAGIPCVVFLPKNKVSPAQLVQPMANGAVVMSLDTDFDGCMKLVQDVTKDGSIYLANSMNSLRLEGQKTIAIEIAQQFGWELPDFVVLPGGNLGNVYAFYKGFKLMKDLGLFRKIPRLVVAQTEQANPLYRAFKNGWETYKPLKAKPTHASAIQIGAPVSIHRAIRAIRGSKGLVEKVTENQLMNASARADRTGTFSCPHTGVALAALEKLVKKKVIRPKHKVVVVSTAHGLKFAGTKANYHAGTLDRVRPTRRNIPIESSADSSQVLKALEKALKKL
tara:strand:+ start:701 stop:2026 length:1326 start_codon:yes stop_codon:yes gene_type:complete